jgi:hypothetical protein
MTSRIVKLVNSDTSRLTGHVPTLLGLIARITSENRYDETPTGPGLGSEEVEWKSVACNSW